MPYITIKQPPVYRQITFEEIIAGVEDLSKYVQPNIINTRTYFVEQPNLKLLENTDTKRMIEVLRVFNHSKESLFTQNRISLYHTFHIPKNSDGLRRIDAPLPELMTALRELKTLLEINMFALYHTTTFAYRMVERDYIDYLIKQCGEKHDTDIEKVIKADLSA
ncbi:MAG: hypothetical protein FWE74_08755 [Oscillospiraceae bacterium]|nr:hypothetical protein [Oscillospiraceae bacterium]